MTENVLKPYDLYILRRHFQVRAKLKMMGDEPENVNLLSLYQHRSCPDPVEPEVQQVEKYEILLDTTSPNMQDLYGKIKEVCPEFSNKQSFHLYWKYSATKVLPISNYISYLSMVALIAENNANLYLVAREWNDTWLQDPAATYLTIPEDEVLVSMVSPRQSVFTRMQEYQLNMLKTAARPEFTRTYSPPQRELVTKDKDKPKEKKEVKKQKSPKSKGTNKK